MSHEEPQLSLEDALVVAHEVGKLLGGRQQRAIELVCAYASRARSVSSSSISAVALAASGVQHFVKAREELDAGLSAIEDTTREIRDGVIDPQVDPDDD